MSDDITENQWYDLAQQYAAKDWSGFDYPDLIKAVCRDYAAVLAQRAAPAPQAAGAELRRVHDVLHKVRALVPEKDSAHAEIGAAMATLRRLMPGGVWCQTCNDNGLIGGPSFYVPDEGGAPCPDCLPLYAAQAAPAGNAAPITWPKARDVGRIGDMSPSAHMRVGFDSDNDVFVSVWDESGGATVEFCNGGGGGGQSMRTRLALIALMVAIEADNAERPSRDWWAQRAAQAAGKGK